MYVHVLQKLYMYMSFIIIAPCVNQTWPDFCYWPDRMQHQVFLEETTKKYQNAHKFTDRCARKQKPAAWLYHDCQCIGTVYWPQKTELAILPSLAS